MGNGNTAKVGIASVYHKSYLNVFKVCTMSVVCVVRGYQWSSVDQCSSPLVSEVWAVP